MNKEWQHDAVALANDYDLSWRAIAELVDKPKSTVSDFLRNYFAMKSDVEEAESGEHDNTRILFISDMHIPYQVPGLISFLEGLKVRYEPTRVICLGDEIDGHALSFHDSDPDLPSAGDELRQALPVIKEIEKLFPKMDIIDSNHGSLIYRKGKHHGIPRHYLRSYNEILEVGEGWVWHNDLTLDMSAFGVPDVYVHHGKSSNGIRLSQTMGMSSVQGHYHESMNIQYWANPNGLYYSMQCGCLIDKKSYAFAYNNVNLKRPLIGTGLILEGTPILEVFPL